MSTLHSTLDSGSGDAAPSGGSASAWAPEVSMPAHGKKSSMDCGICGSHLLREYFRLNGLKICDFCAGEARIGRFSAGAASTMTALIAGLVGFVVCPILYTLIVHFSGEAGSAFAMITGWIIGRAVLAGARGIGSSRLQLIAMALTYLSVALQGLPVLILGLYANHASLGVWIARLLEAAATGLLTPYRELISGNDGAWTDPLLLASGLLVAWVVTRAKRQVVSGPYDIASA